MKKDPYITIGTKGCIFPPITKLADNRLRIGKNRPGPWQKGRAGHDKPLIAAGAWVSESEVNSKGRSGEFEIYPLSVAIRNHQVIVLKNLTWTARQSNISHQGTGYVPRFLLTPTQINQVILIAVKSNTWEHGWIELKRNKYNDDKVVDLPFKKDLLASFGTLSVQTIEFF